MTFADALTRELDREGISQAEGARRSGFNQSTFNQYCTGAQHPTLENAKRLVRAFPALCSWFFDGAVNG